jgi:hypothetical protein
MATGATIEVDFFNTYIVRRTLATYYFEADFGPTYFFSWAAIAPEIDVAQTFSPTSDANRNWYFEESRIRGGYNNVSTDQGVKAYLDEEFPLQQRRISTLIYSGVYNSRTGINQTNVFSIGDAITKSLDPVYGSIQKTYAEETNLIVFQENRIHRALIDKDTIYTTESGTQTQAGKAVIGQFVQYKGEYGISKNPESFAIYNYRKYFSDKNRNAIMRLSNDGLTEVSMYGMRDYFRDELAEIPSEYYSVSVDGSTTAGFTIDSGGGTGETYVDIEKTSIQDYTMISTGMQLISGGTALDGYITAIVNISNTLWRVFYSKPFADDLDRFTLTASYKVIGQVKGGWDIHAKNYVVSLQKSPNQVSTSESSFKTLTFDEEINGWVSFLTFKPNQMFSLINKFYTVGKSDSTTASPANNSAELYIHYAEPNLNNRGVFYGLRKPSSVTFVFNPQPDVMKNFNTISYEGSNGWEIESFVSGFTGQDPNPDGTATYVQNNDDILSIKSYDEGAYVDANTGYTLRAGFDRKENRYVANLRNNSTASSGEIIFGAQISGIKGYFATIKIETDGTTQLGGPKELWSAGSNFVTSSF